MRDKTISKGFLATKFNETFEVIVDVTPICFYIFTFRDGNIVDQEHRTNLNKATELVEKYKSKCIKKKFTIKEYGVHNVQIDKKSKEFKTKLG